MTALNSGTSNYALELKDLRKSFGKTEIIRGDRKSTRLNSSHT